MRLIACLAILLVGTLGGCLDSKDGDGGDAGNGTGTTTSGSSTDTSTRPGNGTTPGGLGNASLVADVTNGTAPLNVTFTINATAGALAWRLALGDGNSTQGSTFPANHTYTYSVGGNFSANLTVAFAGGNASAVVPITVAVGNAMAPPDVTHFEYPESLGCAGDIVGEENCLSWASPDASGIDGFWEALDARYWGYLLTSTVSANPDSDCVFTDASFAILGNGNNGGAACQGTVPEGTAWLFIYPYAIPAGGMTVDFTAP